MTAPRSSPEGEIIPPIGHPAPVPDYTPASADRGGETPARPSRRRRGPDLFGSPATHVLVGINCAVFLWMLLTGVSFDSTNDLIRFGATNTSLMQDQGQWYRLVTAIFVHGGWIHLATNMWCLWNLGMLGEPLLGPFGLAAVYILTGAAGNLLSMAWNVLHGYDETGVGASGAVFGIAGILIVLLSNRRLPIPWDELRRLRRSVIQFAILNLVIGGATLFTRNFIRIDNGAHLGGFFAGLALGVPLVPRMTSGRAAYLGRQKVTFAVAALVLSLFGYWIANLR
jgi:rhomboid protease GluP